MTEGGLENLGQLETGRKRFRRARVQTPNSVSFLALAELEGENSVSYFRPVIGGPKRELTEFLTELTECDTELSEFPKGKQTLAPPLLQFLTPPIAIPLETVLSKEYSARLPEFADC